MDVKACIRNCSVNCVHNCDDHSSLDFKSAVQYMKHFIYHFTQKALIFRKYMNELAPEHLQRFLLTAGYD